MIIYQVSCTMSKEVAEEWKRFFLEKHLKDVINTGYFTEYTFRKVIETEQQDQVTYVSEYFCLGMEQLNQYNATAAPILKAEVIALFGGKFNCTRQLLEEVS